MTKMRWAIVTLAACGHVGFDDPGTMAGAPQIIQMQSMLTDGSTAQLSLVSTRAGDLLVVMTSNISDTTPLMSVADDAGDTFESVNVTFTHDLASIGEVWYAANSHGSAATVTITDSASIEREVWILEIEGPTAYDRASEISNQPETGTVDAPTVTPRRVPAAIVSMVLAPGSAIDAGPLFTVLPVLHGDDAAFKVVTASGTYGPVWTVDESGDYGAATVAFD